MLKDISSNLIILNDGDIWLYYGWHSITRWYNGSNSSCFNVFLNILV